MLKIIKSITHLLILLISIFIINEKTFSQHKRNNTAQKTHVQPSYSLNRIFYQNPVFGHDFPDPNLVIGSDGYMYAYSTQANYTIDGVEGLHYIPILRSKNLVDWKYVGDAFKEKPVWKEKGGLWAPDVTLYKGTYILYYSISTWGDENPGIGVAISKKPEGPFIDKGKLFLSREIGVDNSIDPVLFVDKGRPYLFWGSFNGIYGIALSEDCLKTEGEKFQIGGKAYEGSYIYKRGTYYYYFGSTGTCCEGAKSTYQLKVGRSKSIIGPYVDREGKSLLENGGTLVIEKNADSTYFVGPGHNGDIITDHANQTWIVYHAYLSKEPKKGRVMLLDKIDWNDGWPEVKDYQPSTTIQQGPIF